MRRRPTSSTRTDTLGPYTTRVRSPSPVTSVTADQLSLCAPGSLSESLAPLPELRLSTNPQGGQGASSNMGAISQLNLRGLGPNRTLVLLNGHRLTPANTGSAPDINMLPQQLIKRVDLVTGGASAAYRSEEHTSELQSLMRISSAVFCLKKK